MKRIGKLFIMLLTVLLVTGCVKESISMNIKSNGNVELSIIMAFAESMSEDMTITDEDKKEFTKAALSVFGSGYAWLAADAQKELQIILTANQDTPLAENLAPVLCIDVWEHAYYLKHKNLRADYVPDWFAVANWDWAQWCFDHPDTFVLGY